MVTNQHGAVLQQQRKMTKFESPRSKEWINEQRTSDYEIECLSVGIEVSLFLAGIGTRFKIGRQRGHELPGRNRRAMVLWSILPRSTPRRDSGVRRQSH